MTTTFIPEAHRDFIAANPDGTLTLTLTIPATETISIAKHDFILDNRLVPLASHLARYMDGKGAIYNPANSALKTWRDSDPSRDKDSVWDREDSKAFLDAYLEGRLGGGSVDPVAREARALATAHLMKKAGVSKAADAFPKLPAYLKMSTSEKTGKPVYTWIDSAIFEFVARFDAAQTEAGKPELGFMAKARTIVSTRDEPVAVDVAL